MTSWNLETPYRKFEESYETQWSRRFLDPDVQYRWTIPGNYMILPPPKPPTVPDGYVIYINASSTSSGGSVPDTNVNNTAVTKWGPFTTSNSPLYFSAGGPNNKPYEIGRAHV